jgi:hypothetical protein
MERPMRPRLGFAVALLLVPFASFAGASGNNDGVCDGSGGGGRDNEGADIQCDVIAGPGSLTVKGVVHVGVGFCQDTTNNLPLFCASNPGDINSLGAASFGDDAWSGSREINVDVTHDQQTCTAATSPPCGFTVTICNDRNQDGACTTLSPDDETASTAASEGVLGACKDNKTACDDPNEASWQGCLRDSIHHDWADDQVSVAIGAEAGPATDPDLQAAVSVGTYTIFVEDMGICTSAGGGDGAGGGLPVGRMHITIHRFSEGGIRLLVAPSPGLGWVCRDMVADGSPAVMVGSTLAGPNPEVQCTPPPDLDPPACMTLDTGGYHAAAGGGNLTVWSECDGLAASATMSLPFQDPGFKSQSAGAGVFPWTCRADESGLVAGIAPDYWFFCDVNLSPELQP